MANNENFSKKLLVEGRDDEHVIYALRALHNVNVNFDVIDCKGFPSLLDAIPVRLKQPDIETIGIIVDADDNINNRWQAIHAVLTKAGFVVPGRVIPEGLIFTNPESEVRVGVWIMPNNNINGMLEDFIGFLVPDNDALLLIANRTLDEIEAGNHNKYSPVHKTKALIHTWLAWQKDPGTPMGQAITKRYLNTSQEVCQRLIAWLRATFDSE